MLRIRPAGRIRSALVGIAVATVVAAGGAVATTWSQAANAATVTVTNATQFTDTTGNVVHAHGGGMIKVGSYYYWFGENRNDNGTFRYVSVYRSADLRTWEFRNNVLTQSSASELAVANIERPKVIYNAASGKYVLWAHWENGSDYTEARTAVATSSTVDGNYTYLGSSRPLGYTSRDMTVFADDDGSAYLISATNANADLNVYKLSSDYTSAASLVQTLWAGSWREAPAMFKRNGVYFLVTSGATGWAPNQQKYATATSVSGTWSSLANFGNSIAYGSQAAYVQPVAGTSGTSYLYLGDRWAGAWSGKVNDSQYVWLPLTFASNTSLSMSWYPKVSIDTATGTIAGSGTGNAHEYLKPRHSGKCLDVVSAATTDGANVIQYTCGTGANQQWQVFDLGTGYYSVIARHSNKCLTVPDASTADGVQLQQSTCTGATNQQWQFVTQSSGYPTMVARHSGKCADVASWSTADSAKVVQYTCTNATNEQFQRVAVS